MSSGDQTLALPQGGGAVGGLGGSFAPDLNTGGGGYSIPIDLPQGVDGHTPKLALQYATGHPAGPFGFGWAMPLVRIERGTAARLPRYDATDELVLPGAGPLRRLPGPARRLVPETDGLGWRIRALGGEADGFEVTERSGVRHTLGSAAAARIQDPEAPSRIFAWLLERSETPAGEIIAYEWAADGAQRLLKRVSWAGYALDFVYEARPDPIHDGRPGFLLSTGRRCSAIELHVTAEAPSLVRRWTLDYAAAPGSGHSLLASVTLSGHGAGGETAALPPLRFAHSTMRPEEMRLAPLPREVASGLLDGAVFADLSGDGLPDLVDLARGRIAVARNQGGIAFAPMRRVDARGVPGFGTGDLFAADVAGRGRVDLLSVQSGLAYRYPIEGDAAVGRPLVSRAAPSARPGDAGVRFADVDGDRAIDLVTLRGDVLTLSTQRDGRWRAEQRRLGPEDPLQGVDTSDETVLFASMKGDGLPDLAQVRSGEVRWWPALGHGRWGAPRIMADSPVLPPRFRRDRLFLQDVDGDGCADLVYLDTDRVRLWLNRGGNGFAAELTVPNVPGLLAERVEPVDLEGSGAAGLVLAGRRGGLAAGWYLAFRPLAGYLLTAVDGPMGHSLRIAYGSSVREAARDRAQGRTWPGFLPMPVPVVTAVTSRRHRRAAAHTTRYRYHDGNWDTGLRRFLGFAEVETIEDGDASAAGVRTVSHFHAGRPPERVGEAAPPSEAIAAQALRGRLVRSRVYALGGARPLLEIEQTWQAHIETIDGVPTARPRLVERRERYLDGGDAPWRQTVTRQLAWDAFENVTESEQTNELAADPAARETVRTVSRFAVDAERWIADRPARVTQTDGEGRIRSLRITRYDGPAFGGLPEGQVDLGRVTSEERLVLTDAQAAAAYGDALPDFAALGYHRRADVAGWFVWQVRYDRTGLDAAAPALVALDARGNRREVGFDAARLFPLRTTDAHGNVATATLDARAARLATLTDPNGAVHRNRYDPLGRIVAEYRPGDAEDDPTLRYRPQPDAELPFVERVASPLRGDAAHRMTVRQLFDGEGERVLRATLGDDGRWIVDEAVERNWRGLEARRFAAHALPAGAEPAPPAADLPHEFQTYDALGRPLVLAHPDGTRRRASHAAGHSLLFDEEDTAEGGPHANTPTRYELDAAGRVRRVVARNGAAEIVTAYRYDLRNAPVEITDAAGRAIRILYDLEGRRLRVDHPDAGALVFVHDATGNLVERRNGLGQRVVNSYDALNRLRTVAYPDTGEPGIVYRYLDRADAADGVDVEGRAGRLAEVRDSLGITTLRYDALGEVVLKRIERPGRKVYELGREVDRLGRLTAVHYPQPARNRPAPVLRYRYDRRGQLVRIDGVIEGAVYDAAGLATEIRHANGVRTVATYDARQRARSAEVLGPGGEVLDRWALTLDAVGNVTALATTDPSTSWSLTLDDLYQLRRAARGDGTVRDYAYDGAGNVTARSDTGAIRYGENGASAGLATTAGERRLLYDAIGRQVDGPDGKLRYDPLNRVVRITARGLRIDQSYGAFGEPTIRVIRQGNKSTAILRLDAVAEVHAGQLVFFVVDGPRRIAWFLPDQPVSHLHKDHRGSTVLVTGAGGAVQRRFAYDPFGRLRASPAAISGPDPGGRFDGYEPLAGFELYFAGGRVYDPRLGRFTTPDPLISDLWNPLALNAYAYAANNPLTVADPSGRAWWHVALAVLAVVAVVVLTVVTFGAGLITLGAMIGVFAAMAVGGAVGGIAAAQAGGGVEEVLLGIFAGAALAGAAALGGALAGAGFAAAFGSKAFLTHVLTGAVSGLLIGAATGFASGFAGGMGTAGEIWERTWQSALAGFVTGALFGVASYGFQQGWFGTGKLSVHGPTKPLGKAAQEAAAEAAKSLGEAGNAGAIGGAEVGSAALEAGKSFAGNFFTFGGQSGLPVLEILVFNPVAQNLIVGGVSSLFALDLVDDIIKLLRENEVKSPPIKGEF